MRRVQRQANSYRHARTGFRYAHALRIDSYAGTSVPSESVDRVEIRLPMSAVNSH